MILNTPKKPSIQQLQLEVQNLSKTYGKHVQAIKKVSFSIGPGIFGLLGPNGAGKTTLMNILATLILPNQGTVHFQGENLLTHPHRIRQQLGYLPQAFGVYPRTSAWKLLDYLAVLKGIGPKSQRYRHLQELLELTHLFGDRHRPVAHFSGGMKQRFGLAQAMLGSPRLLIVDEPTAGLDPYERNHFHQIMGELAKEKIILLSTHLVADVANLCKTALILNSGKVLFMGQPTDLLEKLKGQVWSGSCDGSQLETLKQSYPVLSVRFVAGHQRVHLLSDQPPPGFESVCPDLEDAYFAVLHRGGAPC